MASSNVLVKILGLGGEEILSFSAAASRPVRRLKRQLEILTGCPVLQQVFLRLSIEKHWVLYMRCLLFVVVVFLCVPLFERKDVYMTEGISPFFVLSLYSTPSSGPVSACVFQPCSLSMLRLFRDTVSASPLPNWLPLACLRDATMDAASNDRRSRLKRVGNDLICIYTHIFLNSYTF